MRPDRSISYAVLPLTTQRVKATLRVDWVVEIYIINTM